MRYVGSKRRISKEIIPIMTKSRGGRTWVEPFVGGANLIDKIDGCRIGADSNEYLIALLRKLQAGWLPPTEISEQEYKTIKESPEFYDPALVASAMIGCAFGGMWGDVYARGKARDGSPRNHALEFHNNVKEQAPRLAGAEFYCCSYDELAIPDNSILYCDPPYMGTNHYKDAFDHVKFWQWCRDKSGEGHRVFVSEYAAPGDFICIWQKEINANVSNQSKKESSVKRLEKLFIYSPDLC